MRTLCQDNLIVLLALSLRAAGGVRSGIIAVRIPGMP